jgi:hypothetical protein
MSNEPTKFDHHIEDYCEERASVIMTDGEFHPAVMRLLEDMKWQVERESERPPFHAPLLHLNNTTHSPNFTRIFNGVGSIEDIPTSDYLTNRFGVEEQFDKLTDISARVIAACAATRRDDQTMVVWRGFPAITFTRQLHPKGLLLLVYTQVAWI